MRSEGKEGREMEKRRVQFSPDHKIPEIVTCRIDRRFIVKNI